MCYKIVNKYQTKYQTMNKEEKIVKLGKNYINDWIKKNPNKRFDLSTLSFEGVDFSGWRFSKSSFNNSKFINCDFSNSDLSEVSALGVNFTGSMFIKSALYRANLSRSICIDVNFENAWLYRCVFTNSKIINCNFHLAKIQKVRWPVGFRLD